MSWFDEFERIRNYIKRRIRELEEEIDSNFNILSPQPAGSEEFLSFDLEQPLHSIYEDVDKYIVVVDVPYIDESSVVINARDNYLEIVARLRRTLTTNELGYKFYSTKITKYSKKILLPNDSDVSKLSYTLKAGRLLIYIPKRR